MISKLAWFTLLSLSMVATEGFGNPGSTADTPADASIKSRISAKIGATKYQSLVELGLVPNIEKESRGQLHCARGDGFTVSEKAVLSDLVVYGEIAEVEYLYREGGPFKTLYRIKVKETLKGKPAETVEVLSHYGPLTMDHRRWRSDGGIALEKGDAGYFFVSDEPIKEYLSRFPERSSMLAGKYMFLQADRFAAYLVKGFPASPELDAEYLEISKMNKSHRRNQEVRMSVNLVANLIGK